MIVLPRPCICLVTSRRALDPDARTERDELLRLEGFLEEALAAGVDLIQVRERDLPAAVLRGFVARIVAHASTTSTRILVNDRVDVAVAADAHGVHLRGDGPPSDRVRDLVGPDALVGRSIHSAIETGDGADLFVFGTVFKSESKPADAPIAGLAGLTETAARTTVPVLAIGGVTPDRVGECRSAGAAGIAAIGIFLPLVVHLSRSARPPRSPLSARAGKPGIPAPENPGTREPELQLPVGWANSGRG